MFTQEEHSRKEQIDQPNGPSKPEGWTGRQMLVVAHRIRVSNGTAQTNVAKLGSANRKSQEDSRSYRRCDEVSRQQANRRAKCAVHSHQPKSQDNHGE